MRLTEACIRLFLEYKAKVRTASGVCVCVNKEFRVRKIVFPGAD